MLLRGIELENFKSFGRRIVVPFLQGYTAITGPNGSGKSNISDAILFVLGPSSPRAIRAGKLTDLIFNGGKTKQAAKQCKVSLTFDNSDRTVPLDQDEITLTRIVRYSKSSKDNYYSYFYVNGRASSLTEFENLLAHARISADGYNIVQQGDVTRICEMTALERRRLLDDIAGITKFDDDISRAEKKKLEVEANLQTIGTILDEIHRQLKLLEKDRDGASRYRELKTEHRMLSAKLAAKRKDVAETGVRATNEQVEKHTADKHELEARLDALRSEIQETEASIRGVDERISALSGEEGRQLREKLDTLRTEMTRAQELANHARQEIAGLKEQLQQARAQLATAEKEQKKLAKDREGLERKLAESRKALDERNAELEGAKDLVSRSNSTAGDIQRELAKMKVAHDRLLGEVHEQELERDRLQAQVDRLKTLLAESEEVVKSTEFEIKDIDWNLKELRKEDKGASEKIDELKKKHFAQKKDEAGVSKQLAELEPVVRKLRNDYSQLKAESDAAESVSKGYTTAVQAILHARDEGKLKGVRGTVAELAKVKREHETALEVAAGGRMAAIVTDTDEDAARAIDFLKRTKLGRATFLPLNKMTAGRPQGKPLMTVREDGAVGFAIDLIQCDAEYRPAMWYVFRDTVVVKGLEVARRLMGGVRLVSLDGEIIDAGGAMTGGVDPKQAKLKFGAPAQEDLDKVGKRLRAAVEQQERLSEQLLQIREELRRFEDEMRSLHVDTAGKSTRLQDLEAKRKEYDAKLAAQGQEAERLSKEMEQAARHLEKAAAGIATAQSRREAMDKSREERAKLLLKSTAKDLAEKLQRLQDACLAMTEECRDGQSRLATLDKQRQIVEERVAELRTRAEGVERGVAENQELLKQNDGLARGKEEELAVLVKMEEQTSGEFRKLQKARDEAFEKKSDLTAKHETLVARLDSLGDLITQLQAKIPGLEAELAEASYELQGYTDVQLPSTRSETLDELKARNKEILQSLDRIGPINMRALEDYDGALQRKTELEDETSRLEAQKAELLQLVEEITTKKKEGLMKVFTEINKNFQEIFARLSDGGKAELRLESEARPFEGGLIIRAQPKGKKVYRLDLLSGGEKSLTSLAFIFAIQRYAPSPFYILDEVDQNLDGINAELIARMIKANSSQAQFIQVSLRKVTLKEADHVYGVTMQETGLTDIIGEVRVDEIVEEPAKEPRGKKPEAAVPEVSA